jgi:hypothetical protein
MQVGYVNLFLYIREPSQLRVADKTREACFNKNEHKPCDWYEFISIAGQIYVTLQWRLIQDDSPLCQKVFMEYAFIIDNIFQGETL